MLIGYQENRKTVRERRKKKNKPENMNDEEHYLNKKKRTFVSIYL